MHNSKRASALLNGVQRLWRGTRQTARLMIGIPDYDTYVAHCRQHHPERPPMTREAFFRNRLDARYGGNGRVGCC